MAIGTIKKLVLVASADQPPADGSPADGSPSQGYGIILGENGREVFFLDTAVNEVAFRELTRGQTVRYTMEEGPLSRAMNVVPSREDPPGSINDEQAAPQTKPLRFGDEATKP